MADGGGIGHGTMDALSGSSLVRASVAYKLDLGMPEGLGALRTGWSTPEAGFVWMIGEESELVLPLPPGPGPLHLVARLVPFGSSEGAPGMRLRIAVDGHVLADEVITRARVLTCPLPPLPGRTELRLFVTHPDHRVPAEVVGNGDVRRLSFAMTALRLVRFTQSTPDLPMTGWSFPEEPSDPDVMMAFESLGHNCELGLVQRRLGAEPLGLLRFSATPLEGLLDMLESRFASLLDPSQISIEPVPLANGESEYIVRHRRYDLSYHTLTLESQMTIDRCRHREMNRLKIALRGLLAQLETGDRICVFKQVPPLSAGDMLMLHIALQEYGPNTLLCVTEADAAHEAGTVRCLLDGLIHGVVPRFAPLTDAGAGDDLAWLAICRQAYSLWTSRAR